MKTKQNKIADVHFAYANFFRTFVQSFLDVHSGKFLLRISMCTDHHKDLSIPAISVLIELSEPDVLAAYYIGKYIDPVFNLKSFNLLLSF